MEITNRLKKLAFSLAIVGFISAIFLFGLIFGLGIGWEIAYKDNKFFPIGYNPIQDLANTGGVKKRTNCSAL